ncbi:MAG: hypothetical protein H7A25_26075 [Leptospiraceae bacterium]|nr:hypothetical protein [Leptospiraceae bacterium]
MFELEILIKPYNFKSSKYYTGNCESVYDSPQELKMDNRTIFSSNKKP